MATGKPLRRRISGILRWKLQPLVLRALCRPARAHNCQLLGRGWPIPKGLLSSESKSICAGAGEFIDLELWLSQTLGATVYLLDPTPRAIRFVESLDLPEGLHFESIGLWSRDETIRLHAPANPEHVSHSIEELGDGGNYFEAPCKSLASVMASHDLEQLDLLKMNIEGAEYEVLDAMLETDIRPRILTLTFEGSSALRNAVRYTNKLRGAGYIFEDRYGWAFTFVHDR